MLLLVLFAFRPFRCKKLININITPTCYVESLDGCLCFILSLQFPLLGYNNTAALI